jgi:hypothetical protein
VAARSVADSLPLECRAAQSLGPGYAQGAVPCSEEAQEPHVGRFRGGRLAVLLRCATTTCRGAELGAQLRVQRADESLDGRARQSRQLEIVRGGLVRARAVAPLLLLEISLRDLVMS